tara:strand:+ start:87 stop:287 length:201 start_codon:yes stop_codon:yes gene_type:complete
MAKKISKITDSKKIISELNFTRKSLLNLRFQKTTGQLEKTSEIKKTRKKIAQLLTKKNQNIGLKNV